MFEKALSKGNTEWMKNIDGGDEDLEMVVDN
jgi:hypothetical protein